MPGKSIRVTSQISGQHLTKSIILITGLQFTLMIGESSNTAESIISIEQLPAFRTILVSVVVTLGDVIFLLSDDPTVCTIIGR
ncbi:hypothetical protein [Desulfopila sp. IMCC35008]|uniref:hypothetical protein n=1 Tax=Desulfopila sp. IMCC35008 TaxID=2653858 RepID=UPI0013D6B149|nr:hypothetical protein [Desulfopila sp. IMCC35008]